MNGFINLFKAEGLSSAALVGKIKRFFKVKCGHMGTLDPLASGVLPIGIGKSTRLFSYLLDKNKEYTARFKFGETTDTLDRGGEIITKGGYVPTLAQITSVLPALTGEVAQIPPAYSAKHVAGVRSYALARQGKAVELPPKLVTIDGVSLTKQTGEGEFEFVIRCGSGTYIRSICRDLAHKLDTCAYMTYLQRTKSGGFFIENSVDLDTLLENGIEKYLLPPQDLIDYKRLDLDVKQAFKVLNGVAVATDEKDGNYRLFDDSFMGIGVAENGLLRLKTFLR